MEEVCNNMNSSNVGIQIEIVPIPKREQKEIIYQLVSKQWKVDFYFDDKEELPFITNMNYYIFASNSKAWFGTSKSASDLLRDHAEVVMILKSGHYAIVANSLKDFFELYNFYPYWLDIIASIVSQNKIQFTLFDFKKEEDFVDIEYIANTLNLSHNFYSPLKLFTALQQETEFSVFNKNTNEIYKKIV